MASPPGATSNRPVTGRSRDCHGRASSAEDNALRHCKTGPQSMDDTLSFLALGDWGRRGSAAQRAVAEAMATIARREGCSFVVTTGDNFYEDGVAGIDDDHWHDSFVAVYERAGLGLPFYPVLGNHDYRGDPGAQVRYSELNPRWRLPARYYTRVLTLGTGTRVQLLFLDTTPFLERYGPFGVESISRPLPDPGRQLDWLGGALSETRADWRIAIGHHPIRSGSEVHGGTAELEDRLLSVLRRHGAHAYLCGHEHDLQHVSADGLEHVLSGAGADCRPTGRLATTRFAASTPGFALLRLTSDWLELRFYDHRARLLHDFRRCRSGVTPLRVAAAR